MCEKFKTLSRLDDQLTRIKIETCLKYNLDLHDFDDDLLPIIFQRINANFQSKTSSDQSEDNNNDDHDYHQNYFMMLMFPKHFPSWFSNLLVEERRRWKKIFAILLLVAILGLGFWSTSNFWLRLAKCMGRRIIFKLENHWNWLDAYYDRCLFSWQDSMASPPSSVKQNNNNDLFDCDYCEDVKQLLSFDVNMDHHHQAEDHNNVEEMLQDRITHLLASKLPFIYRGNDLLENEIQYWPLYQDFFRAEHFGTMLYPANETSNGVCRFRSNLINTRDPNEFFSRLSEQVGLSRSWFVHWENCRLKQNKKLRHFYQRPRMLPPMIEISKPNWLLISSSSSSSADTNDDYNIERTFKLISPSYHTDVLIIIQIHGSIELLIEPRKVCLIKRICSNLKQVTLQKGELVIIDPNYWQLNYRPDINNQNPEERNSTINLTLILAGIVS